MSEGDIRAVLVSLQIASLAALILTLGCIPLALWLARSASVQARLVGALTTLPLVLPPTVLGYYLISALAPDTVLGSAWGWIFDRGFAFSFPGLLLGSMVYSLPFAVQPQQAAFRQLNAGWLEVAATLGLSPLQRLVRVVVPQMRPALLDSLALVFAHSLGEFGIVLMIGGAVPGETRTASIAVFQHFEQLNFAAANQLALLLLAMSVLMLVVLYWLRADRLGRRVRR